MGTWGSLLPPDGLYFWEKREIEHFPVDKFKIPKFGQSNKKNHFVSILVSSEKYLVEMFLKVLIEDRILFPRL